MNAPQPPDNFTGTQLAISGIIALMGGVVHEIAHGKTFSPIKMAAGATVGMFTGAVAFFACQHFTVGMNASICLTGIAGYMGAPLLDWAGVLLRKRAERIFGDADSKKDGEK